MKRQIMQDIDDSTSNDEEESSTEDVTEHYGCGDEKDSV